MSGNSEKNTFAYEVSSESFVAALFGGKRTRPEGKTDVRIPALQLDLEVKSSKRLKPQLNRFQISYHPRKLREYHFGDSSFHPFDEWQRAYVAGRLVDSPLRYYYVMPSRDDSFSKENLGDLVSTVGINWESVHMVPAEVANTFFMVAKLNGSDLDDSFAYSQVLDEVLYVTKGICDGTIPTVREETKHSWASWNFKDLDVLMKDDPSLASGRGLRRVERFKRLFPEYAKLEPLYFEAPGQQGSPIPVNIWSRPRDVGFFNNDFTKHFRRSSEYLEKIMILRRQAVDSGELARITKEFSFVRRRLESLGSSHVLATPLLFSSAEVEAVRLYKEDLGSRLANVQPAYQKLTHLTHFRLPVD